MTLDDELDRSRRRVERHWHHISEHCPDPRLHGSHLEPVEGMNGHRSLDLDRTYHIDHFAVVRGVWTPVSTRYQSAEFADYKTVTFRRSEVRHMRSVAKHPDQLGAALHVQMYGCDDECTLIVIAEVAPLLEQYANLSDAAIWWLTAPDGNQFTPLTRGALSALDALVWFFDPGKPEQISLFDGWAM